MVYPAQDRGHGGLERAGGGPYSPNGTVNSPFQSSQPSSAPLLSVNSSLPLSTPKYTPSVPQNKISTASALLPPNSGNQYQLSPTYGHFMSSPTTGSAPQIQSSYPASPVQNLGVFMGGTPSFGLGGFGMIYNAQGKIQSLFKTFNWLYKDNQYNL